MLYSKTPISEILKNNNIAIKVNSVEHVKKLVPDYPRIEDLELFFENDKNHSEFIGVSHGPNGSGFFFIHPENKKVIDFENVEFDL